MLLLSEDHHRHLKGGEASSGPLNSQGGHTEEPGGEERLTPAEKAADLRYFIHQLRFGAFCGVDAAAGGLCMRESS